MNILFLFNNPIIASYGGVERVTDTLAREMKKRGHNVAYLCHQKIEYLNDKIDQAAVQYYIDLSQNNENILQKVQDIMNSHHTEFIIVQNLNRWQLDIAALFPSYVKRISVCHVQPYSFDSINRKRIASIKPVNIKHQIFLYICLIFPYLYKLYFQLPENKCFRRALSESDKLCLISNKFFPRIAKHISNISKEKLVSIPNPNTFRCLDKLPEKKKIILWVGRIENRGKNAFGFIEMWKHFVKNNPDWNAIIIGDGSDYSFNKNYVATENIPNVMFTGNIDNVQDYYRIASFVVVTSWSESWSMVLTEGMSMGCIPCAYNTYETIYDIIDDDVNGLIIDKVSPLYMAERLSSLVKEAEKMRRMSFSALEKVKLFDVRNVVDQWENLFKSML